jgi:diadenosine tetraphosphatase ApaH/serine/threonine PP2A family protein phosphatase
MRIGVFSDVHANLEALLAVREAYRREVVEKLYCLGDVVGYGANPNECADIVSQMAEITILGNHDAAVAGSMDYSYYYEAARQVLDAHAAQLSKQNSTWLRSLPYEARLKEIGVLLCHGSPLRSEEFDYVFTPEQAEECLTIYDKLENLTLIGHSHLCKVFALSRSSVIELPPKDFRVEENYRYIVSVGSVGQPRDYDNRASYTIYDSETREFEFKRIEYDIELAAQRIFDSELERNFGHRLFIGV